MESHKIKSVNTDKRVKNRFRFTSSKQRAKHASADVYRSYKRRIGVTSAASREERVHHPHREESGRSSKRQRTSYNSGKDSSQKKAVIRASGEVEQPGKEEEEEDADLLDTTAQASFSEELDLAFDRNASEVFGKFYREMWPLVRSLPEVLHHTSKIVELLLDYMLSPASEPGEKSTNGSSHLLDSSAANAPKRERFVINHATTEILHLLAVLARDLRQEFHPYLHSQIIPRIVSDLLNPPLTTTEEAEKQALPLDVSVIEAAFRALSYVFRYDAEELINEVEKPGSDPCLENLRKYYGSTLAHRRDVARRLAAETFAPLVRKLKSDSSRRRHLRRVIRALAASQSTAATSNSALKLQTNAVDGISHLFFEVARGVAGQMHSKGRVATKVLLDFLCSEGKERPSEVAGELVHSVTSAYLEKICKHLDRNHYGGLLDDVASKTLKVLKVLEDDAGEKLSSIQQHELAPQRHMIRFLDQLVQFREGFLLNGHNDEYKFKSRGELLKVILRVFDITVPLFVKLPEPVQTSLLSLLCNTWKAISDNNKFAERIRGHVDIIVHCHSKQPSTADSSQATRHPAHVLAEDLMPHLPPRVVMGTLGASILSAAADLEEANLDLCLSLILAVVKSSASSMKENDNNNNEGREDALFSLSCALGCHVPASVKEELLNKSMLTLHLQEASALDICRLGVAARCIPFLAMVGTEEDDDEDEDESNLGLDSCFKKVATWLVQLFSDCFEKVAGDPSDGDNPFVTACFALGAVSVLSLETTRRDCNSSVGAKKMLSLVQSSVQKLILSRPSSHWTLKSVSVYVEALRQLDMSLGERDAVFEAITPNLRSESHFRRLYSLRILQSFPKMPYVTDHADLDLADDLDEEVDAIPRDNEEKGTVIRAGLCDILDTLVSIETMPVELENERQLQSLISRVEILGRSAKLPVLYTEAVASHMLGILYVKFAPIWKTAVRAFVALANTQAAFIWPPLQGQISLLMNRFPKEEEFAVIRNTMKGDSSDTMRHHVECMAWESSNGIALFVFGKETSSRLPTDEATVLESVMSVLEGAQQLLMKNNREFVPIFLQFMHSQYYCHYQHDPDARELRLEEHIEDTTR